MKRYSLWIFLGAIFIIRFLTSQPNFKDGQLLRVSGNLLTQPNVFGNLSSFNINGIKVFSEDDVQINYGDFVRVSGKWEGGKLVDAKIEEIVSSDNIFVNVRKHLVDFYESVMPSNAGSLVAGITIGAKSGFSRNFSERLRRAGLTHIIVASGMNVNLVGGFILGVLLLAMSRKKALVVAGISIWFYTFISGFEAPIVRAAVMATTAYVGEIFGRPSNVFRYVFLSAFIMLIVVPSWIGDVGFLLSFATTVSLVLFEAKVGSLIRFVPPVVREDLATSLTASVGSFPVIFYFFGSFNPLAPFINVLVLWMIPIIMVIGAISGILSFVVPVLAGDILILVYPLTAWFISVVNFFGKFSLMI